MVLGGDEKHLILVYRGSSRPSPVGPRIGWTARRTDRPAPATRSYAVVSTDIQWRHLAAGVTSQQHPVKQTPALIDCTSLLVRLDVGSVSEWGTGALAWPHDRV
jgi:hypothetical protein